MTYSAQRDAWSQPEHDLGGRDKLARDRRPPACARSQRLRAVEDRRTNSLVELLYNQRNAQAQIIGGRGELGRGSNELRARAVKGGPETSAGRRPPCPGRPTTAPLTPPRPPPFPKPLEVPGGAQTARTDGRLTP
eukprot:7998118-Pyramimonas_sp.AAC.1